MGGRFEIRDQSVRGSSYAIYFQPEFAQTRETTTMTFCSLQNRVQLLTKCVAALASKLSSHSFSYLEQFPEAVLLSDRPAAQDEV